MERSFWSTIRGKLLSRTILVVLLPVLIIGGAAAYALRSLSSTADDSLNQARTAVSEDVVGTRVAAASDQIAREIAIYVDERISDAVGWSSDFTLVRAAEAAAARANLDRLAEKPIDELEALFAENRRLGNPGVHASLVDAVANTPAFKEIFFTDVNGFNVEYSAPTSDFVQSDEQWWQDAMEQGVVISEPDFDASAGVFAVDISVRMNDNETGEAVGVLKASLDIAVVQTIADRFTENAEGYEVSILDAEGRFLAETASDHDPSHIMDAAYVAGEAAVANDRIAAAVHPDGHEMHPNGFSIDDDFVGGYAHVDDSLTELRSDMDRSVRAFQWSVVVEQPTDVAFAALAPLEGLADEVSSTSSRLTMLLAVLALGAVLAAALVASLFGRRLASPIARLRDAAVETAEVTLPNVVSQIDQLDEDAELPTLEPLVLDTGDEVEDLADSFNKMQQTAADLASQQARMRRKNVATTFVNLGRRNQNLLARQLEHINSMESSERDPEALERLFQLDHLATRMRRNAESLLVLAGEETPRRFRQPVTMHQLIQAAGAEIEDFGRVEMATVDDASVTGSVASDVAHLLAELLENASSFSPPGSSIQVHGRRRANGYALAIVDQGIGMSDDDLVGANARLADPAEFDRAPSAYLGHFVVGHLARRHGIRVWLTDSPYGGITAQLHLPSELMVGAGGVGDPQPAAFPASEVLPEASPDTHVAAADNETARELAEIAALEAALHREPAVDSAAPDSVPAAPEPPSASVGETPEAAFEPPAAAAFSSHAEPITPDPATPALPPVDAMPPAPMAPEAPTVDAVAADAFEHPLADAAIAEVPEAPQAPEQIVAPPSAPAPQAPEAPEVPSAFHEQVVAPPSAPAPQAPEAPMPAAEQPAVPMMTPPPMPAAEQHVEAAPAPVAHPAPAPAAPAPAPAPLAPMPAAEQPAVPMMTPPPMPAAEQHVEAAPAAQAAPVAPAPAPAPAAQPAPAPAAQPAPVAVEPIAATPPAAGGSTLAPRPPRGYTAPAPTPQAETTPSGFRRRRRGHEGAPQAHQPTPQQAVTPRRSPDEVKASLQAFRQGVEAGRAQSPDPTSPNSSF